MTRKLTAAHKRKIGIANHKSWLRRKGIRPASQTSQENKSASNLADALTVAAGLAVMGFAVIVVHGLREGKE